MSQSRAISSTASFPSISIASGLFCLIIDFAKSRHPLDMAWGEWTGFNNLKQNLGMVTFISSLIYTEQPFLIACGLNESSFFGRVLQDDLIRRYWNLLLGQLWFFISLEAWFTNIYQFINNKYISAALLLASISCTCLSLFSAFTSEKARPCTTTTINVGDRS